MTEDDLSLKAAALARRLPEEWAAFVEEFDRVKAEVVDALVSAHSDRDVVQGRAQAYRSLAALFRNAVKDASRIENERSKKRTNNPGR